MKNKRVQEKQETKNYQVKINEWNVKKQTRDCKRERESRK
jgi:hypothetical protein